MKRIILKSGEERRILAGHPWVYDNEVARILGPAGPVDLAPGELADVESQGKTYLGRALVNPHSKILARIYSPSKEGVDKGFFKRRIREAMARRIVQGTYNLTQESVRLVFGEADFLPGLIIDRFVGWPREALEAALPERPITFDMAKSALGPPQSWLAVQFLTYGMDMRREEILIALEEVLAAPWGLPAGIIEKSGAKVRELEGLPLKEGLIQGSFPSAGIIIFENRFPFAVHLEYGQKTGHFLDQQKNRLLTACYAQGLTSSSPQGVRVLDACAYTGGFGIHAARFGASSVLAVDSSGEALEMATQNARLNGVELTTVQADIFDLLRSYQRAKERFDLIILDPPAFAKTRSALEGALRGYKEINLRALKLLTPGGILVSCSCSQALDESRFKLMIAEAALDAERRLVMLDFRYQAPDHPILLGYDESLYLKCGYYRAVI
ncbi:MAG: class I SAM-dependent rRNA methyltransferase [Treponema sp.]|jgi:23S rRNA (cytosine1962-C5)-methyltransferase|nr:class I SAM-dependent rRNA methyltransferase [Treponema sp.]